jgi:hypothetical protein
VPRNVRNHGCRRPLSRKATSYSPAGDLNTKTQAGSANPHARARLRASSALLGRATRRKPLRRLSRARGSKAHGDCTLRASPLFDHRSRSLSLSLSVPQTQRCHIYQTVPRSATRRSWLNNVCQFCVLLGTHLE